MHRTPSSDQYFKGALFIHTLRSLVDDDARWWTLVRELYQEFKYRNIMTEDIVAFFNARLGTDLTPVFDQYLRQPDIPTLELVFNGDRTVSYRWKSAVPGFAMPVKVGRAGAWQVIRPTSDWQTLETRFTKDRFEVATDLYFINVTRDGAG
jgi:aminopeptidase N